MVVVANRLPFDLEEQPDGSTKARPSPGGLVTALEPILSRRHGAWIGWPGTAGVELEPSETDGLTLHPVTLSAEDVDLYYEGFSNATLWPLYHDAVVPSEFHREWWDAYRTVNRRFAERAAEVAGRGAIVWVHDYQLQLVPEMLREMRPDVRIGFFLHIPFPPTELFDRLPWRTQILRGLLGADLVGFQLPGGGRNFLRLARRLLGVKVSGKVVEYQGRKVLADAFPISIDSKSQAELADKPGVRAAADQIRADLGHPKKIILGVDRLDYTKGIDIRLEAFRELLSEADDSVADAVMIQVATPSRERLQSYISMRENIERQVGALNGDYGSIGRPAVHYLHQSFPREELAGFFVAADVMTVTPLRDGMNLVAKEYVASRVNGDGVLLLSEFTGAARELRSALLVNPYDTDGVKDALRTALTMSDAEARRRMRGMHRQVLQHDVSRWADAFLSALEEPASAAAGGRLAHEVQDAILSAAKAEILLVGSDFDGTLAPIVDDPATARAVPTAVRALHALAALPNTHVAVVSGRARKDLAELLGDTGDLILIGSHGAETDDAATTGANKGLTTEESRRRARLGQALQSLLIDYPDVQLEPKPAGVAVHLRNAGQASADAVTAAIEDDLATWPGIHVLRGKKVIELSVVVADKGTAFDRVAERVGATTKVFLGDDLTDENVFAMLGEGDVGIKVGRSESVAHFRVPDPAHVAEVLGSLLAAREYRS